MMNAFAPYPSHEAPRQEASVADVGRAVMRGWRWVLIPTVLALVGSLSFVMLVPPRYTGEAKILLQTSDSYFTRPGPERYEQQALIDDQAVASQVQVVLSRDLAREAIAKLNLAGNPEFDPAVREPNILQRTAIALGFSKDPVGLSPEERVVEKYYDNLLVYPVGKSRIVAIEFRSKDPDLAARGANTIAELYLARQEDAKKDQARSASTWLGSNIDQLRQQVADAEAKVEAFRSKTGLLVGSGTTTLAAQQMSELSAQLAQSRTARSDAQAKARLIADAIRNGRTSDIPDVANNELIRRLTEQRIGLRAQLALELRSLGPVHPRIKDLTAQLADLEGQIRSAGERTVRTLENDARIAGARVESLEAAVDAQKKIVADANGSEVELRALEREARTRREQLESYLVRYREAAARDADFGAPPDARIVSRAVSPQVPSFPKKLPIVAIATFAALMLSIGAIVARELLASPVAPASAMLPYAGAGFPAAYSGGVRREFDVDVGAGPILDARVSEPDPRYDFAQLIARLERTDTGGRGRVVLVSGIADGANGATEVARGLALSLARRAATIIIHMDANETDPVDAIAGLTDLVGGEATFAEVIHRQRGSNLDYVVTGTLMNEALTGTPDGLDVTLSAFATAYEWTICLLKGSDDGSLAQLVAPRADCVVIASDLEPANPDLVRAYEAMQEAGAKDIVVAREQPTADLHAAA